VAKGHRWLGRKKFLFFLTGFCDAMLVVGRINKILLHVFKDFSKSKLIKNRTNARKGICL